MFLRMFSRMFLRMFVGSLLCMLCRCFKGELANLYGRVWATRMHGMVVMMPFEVSSFANESACRFP